MVGDVAPRRVADRLDDGLVSGLLLEFEQLRVERGFLGGGNDIGLIDDRIARELGEGLRGRGRGCKQQPRKDRCGQRTKQGGYAHLMTRNRPSAPDWRYIGRAACREGVLMYV